MDEEKVILKETEPIEVTENEESENNISEESIESESEIEPMEEPEIELIPAVIISSIALDDLNRIIGWNPHDMTGNTGWITVENAPFNQHSILLEEHDVPLYSYDSETGEILERTAEEIEADTPEPVEPAPTELELLRIQLEEQAEALIELAAMLTEE